MLPYKCVSALCWQTAALNEEQRGLRLSLAPTIAAESEIPFDHFKQRVSPENDYRYQSIDLQEATSVGLLWEMT
ncbi:hypothetical protein [Natrinema gelatinilyticum]|uniref:hypothetical protein n=1 Tax=Natrinema gelatinilyticum TaxID=2961571 RepID=UPI0020C3E23A|nr:hypothetical protein [Natrinema gelatinilyticum]